MKAPLLLSLALLAPLGIAPMTAHAVAPAGAPAVAWQEAGADADVDKAFAQARAEKKPLLLYWGAKWCPPCNQLKATLFNRQDFIEQSRAVIAVHIDGDAPGAQKLGARFKVRGYPTMIMFNTEGAELTRLPGEIDAAQVVKVMQLGLAGGRPVKAVLADARAGKKLGVNEWRLLAFYSWETDEQQLVPPQEVPGLLVQLAVAAKGVDEEVSTRLYLKALAASDEGKGVKPDAALAQRVAAVLASPAESRAQMDVLTNGAGDMVLTLTPEGGAARAKLSAEFETALKRLQNDASLSRADRLTALESRVVLARLDQPKDALSPKLPAALTQEVRSFTTKLDQEITDGYERQACITSAAAVLGKAGLWKESDELLKANLAKSHSPYYLMSYLGGNARKQGRKDEALHWYEEAFNKSEGPATRLQWGSSYVAALVSLAPQDSARIEKAASQLFKDAGADKSAFYERSARSLLKVGSDLQKWSADGKNAAAASVMGRLKTQLAGVCARVDTADKQRATCESVIKG